MNNNFFDFIFNSNLEDREEMKRDLDAIGVDLAESERKLGLLLKQADQHVNLGWIERAKQKQALFEEALKIQHQKVSEQFRNSRQLFEAIFSGKFGPDVKSRAAVFFRNKNSDEVSEEDLRTFIEEFETLGEL